MWLGNLSLVMGFLDSLTGILPDFPDFPDFYTEDFNFQRDIVSLTQSDRITAAKEGKFPEDFLFGVATSAYQIEGAWNVSDKSSSSWDYMTHVWPNFIVDGSNADIAANSYYMYKTDIDLVKQLGANAYRISLSWSRILPNGMANYVSKDGIEYYNNVINDMIAKGITPHVTIHHWDVPQVLHELGGWTSPLMVDWFADYATVVFNAFGDRVKYWTTINEPSVLCYYIYGGSEFFHSVNKSGISDYICGHNVLLAHAKAYRIYDEEFRPLQKGKVGIVLNLDWPVIEGVTTETDETKRWFAFRNGWFLQPIFTDDGDYPQVMKDRIGRNSRIQGYSQSRLPEFTFNEITMIKNSADFLGVNFYYAKTIEKLKNYNVSAVVSFEGDIGMTENFEIGENSVDPADRCTPWALVLLMQRINEQFHIPMFFITESGYWDKGQLADMGRAKYFHEHLTEIPKLIAQGIDIRGYFAWSLVDNFEWIFGYTQRYGLFSIDMSDPQRLRTPKMSTKIISDVYKTKVMPQQFFWSFKDHDFDDDDDDDTK